MVDTHFGLAGKTALVTGASSGLGVLFAKALAAAGADLVLAARRLDRLEETAEAIAALGVKAQTLELDVTRAQSVDDAFTELDARGVVADILVNNAGISRESFLAKTDESEWDAVFDTNLKGVFLVAQAAAQRLINTGKPGAFVNIASILGLQASRTMGSYSAAKAGVLQLTRTQALEWARFGIRVNSISPGFFPTEMNEEYVGSPQGLALAATIPQRRFGIPGELDGALLLLASDAGAYMTGSNIVVDGGLLLNGLG